MPIETLQESIVIFPQPYFEIFYRLNVAKCAVLVL